jgi:hypothetical protein
MKSKTKMCLKNSEGFFVTKISGWRIWSRKEWRTGELLEAIKRHEDILSGKKKGLIKHDRRTTITLFEFKKKRICIKEYRHKGLLSRFKGILRKPKARKAWVMGNGLAELGAGGITPLALLEQSRFGFFQRAFLLMESPTGYIELDRYMIRTFGGTSNYEKGGKGAFLPALASFMAKLYQLKIAHRDLKTCNIMVKEKTDGWKFCLIDMDDIQLYRAVTKKRLIQELVQMNTSTPLFIDKRDRIRFLVRYLKLIGKYKAKDILQNVIRGSRGRELVYVSPEGDVIMAVDWEKMCADDFS